MGTCAFNASFLVVAVFGSVAEVLAGEALAWTRFFVSFDEKVTVEIEYFFY